MADKGKPVTIKKYANRRLYNTGTSTYVTLDDLAAMVKQGEDFVVQDARTSEDITHAVLTQIIFELEGRDGQNLLPVSFLRQLIGFYGDQLQMIVPSYLEHSMAAFTREQETLREQMKAVFGDTAESLAQPMRLLEEQTRRNIEMFQDAMSLFAPPGARNRGQERPASSDPAELRARLTEVQRKLDSPGKR
jgi:polyhydroxyalkanoate synthesis repressor PhaR